MVFLIELLKGEIMKFVDLKSSLNRQIAPGYVISGDDRYLCYNALELIEKAVGLQFADLNHSIIAGDKISAGEIVEHARVFPFGDNYRLLQIVDYKPKSEKQDLEELSKYFENPVETTVVVFFYTNPTDIFKTNISGLINVNCNKLDENMLIRWIDMAARKHEVSIESDASNLLCMYSDYNLAKIATELEKLAGYVGQKGNITQQMIREMVVPEREYQIYELSENITKRNRSKTFEVLNNILERERSSVSLITMLYNQFRRLLNISLSSENDGTIASYLGVKPYAVKMSRQQVKNFSPKSLRKIVSHLAKLEYDAKSGKINGDNAIVFAICNILLIG